MSSEKYHYEPGAIHNDHHKEVNIGQVPERVLNDLIRNFFKDDAEEAEVVEEIVDDGTPAPEGKGFLRSLLGLILLLRLLFHLCLKLIKHRTGNVCIQLLT